LWIETTDSQWQKEVFAMFDPRDLKHDIWMLGDSGESLIFCKKSFLPSPLLYAATRRRYIAGNPVPCSAIHPPVAPRFCRVDKSQLMFYGYIKLQKNNDHR